MLVVVVAEVSSLKYSLRYLPVTSLLWRTFNRFGSDQVETISFSPCWVNFRNIWVWGFLLLSFYIPLWKSCYIMLYSLLRPVMPSAFPLNVFPCKLWPILWNALLTQTLKSQLPLLLLRLYIEFISKTSDKVFITRERRSLKQEINSENIKHRDKIFW